MKKYIFMFLLLSLDIYGKGSGYLVADLNKGNITQENKLCKVLVFDMTTEKSIDKGVANVLTELIIDELSKTELFDIMGQKDIDKMLFWEETKKLKNCTESVCLSQIANAMGADYYIESSIGVIGDHYVLSIKFIDVKQVKIVARTTTTIEKDERVLLREISGIVQNLVKAAGYNKVIKKTNISTNISQKKETNEKEKKEEKELKVEKKKTEDEKRDEKMLLSELLGEKPKSEGKTIKIAPILTTVAGIAIIATGIRFWFRAEEEKKRKDISSDKIKENGELYVNIANACYVVGGFTTSAGVYWFVKSLSDQNKYADIRNNSLLIGLQYSW
jgi:TolB-like protein